MAGWGSGGLLVESACVRACVCVCVGLAPVTRTGQRANYSRHRNGNARTSRVRLMDPAAGVASPGPEALLRPLSRTGRRVGAALLRTALRQTPCLVVLFGSSSVSRGVFLGPFTKCRHMSGSVRLVYSCTGKFVVAHQLMHTCPEQAKKSRASSYRALICTRNRRCVSLNKLCPVCVCV